MKRIFTTSEGHLKFQCVFVRNLNTEPSFLQSHSSPFRHYFLFFDPHSPAFFILSFFLFDMLLFRPVALTSKQEDMLNTFCGFIDKHLLPSSVEKRSVALKLSIELVS